MKFLEGLRKQVSYEEIREVNKEEVPEIDASLPDKKQKDLKDQWMLNKLVATFNHKPIQEDEKLHDVIKKSRYSKMRVNLNFKHNIVDSEKKEQVCFDFLEPLEMMFQATSYREEGKRDTRPDKIIKELSKCA